MAIKRFYATLPVVAVVLMLVAFMAFGPADAQTGKPGAQTPAPVAVTKIQPQSFYDSIEALGTLRANESVVLTASITETVTALHFDDGSRVQAGDILVEMTNAEEKAQLAQVRAETQEARQQLARIETLAKDGASSQSLLDQRRREYKTAQARMNEVASRLKDHVIVAPFSGVVGLRNISAGALLRPGDRITTLDDDEIMKLDFTVPSLFLSALVPGTKITATAREFPGKVFEGKIESVDTQIDPVTRSVVVRALLPNPDHVLKSGLLMRVKILGQERQALLVPEKSIVQEGDKSFVFVLDRSQDPPVLKKTAITIGARTERSVEITQGLSGGDEIVTHGTISAADGKPVKVIASESGSDSLQSIVDQETKQSAAP